LRYHHEILREQDVVRSSVRFRKWLHYDALHRVGLRGDLKSLMFYFESSKTKYSILCSTWWQTTALDYRVRPSEFVVHNHRPLHCIALHACGMMPKSIYLFYTRDNKYKISSGETKVLQFIFCIAQYVGLQVNVNETSVTNPKPRLLHATLAATSLK